MMFNATVNNNNITKLFTMYVQTGGYYKQYVKAELYTN